MNFLKALLWFAFLGWALPDAGDGQLQLAYVGAILGLLGAGATAFGSIRAGDQAAAATGRAAEALGAKNVGFDFNQDPLFGGFQFEALSQLGQPGAFDSIVSPAQDINNRLGSTPAFGHTNKTAFEKGGNIAGQGLLRGFDAGPSRDPNFNQSIADAIGFQGELVNGRFKFQDLKPALSSVQQTLGGISPITISELNQVKAAVTEDGLRHLLLSGGTGEQAEFLRGLLDERGLTETFDRLANIDRLGRAESFLTDTVRFTSEQLGTIGETIESVGDSQSRFEENQAELLESVGGREGLEALARKTFQSRLDAQSGIAGLTSDLAAFASGEGLRGGTNQFGNFLVDTINDISNTSREDTLRSSTVAGFNPGRALSDLETQRRLALGTVPQTAAQSGGELLALLQSFLAPAQSNALAGSQAKAGLSVSNSQLAGAQQIAQAQLLADAGVSQAGGTQGAFGALGQGLVNSGALYTTSRGPAGNVPGQVAIDNSNFFSGFNEGGN